MTNTQMKKIKQTQDKEKDQNKEKNDHQVEEINNHQYIPKEYITIKDHPIHNVIRDISKGVIT